MRSRLRGLQDGYALLLVLGLIALTGATVVALLGLSFTTSSTGMMTASAASQRRAADGALEAALTQLRLTEPAPGDEACDPGDTTPVDTIPFDGGSPDDARDDVVVEVECVPLTPDGQAIAATEPGGMVDVVGADGYTGGVGWATNCTPGDPGPGCFPWQLALGVMPWFLHGPELTSLGPTLVHSGPRPLQVTGDVTVRRSAAVLRNPTDDAGALEVAGQYIQGSTGPFSAQGGGDCGILGDSHLWGVHSARVSDADRTPTCADPTAALLEAESVGPVAPFPIPEGPTTVPSSCPGSQVVTLDPGVYDRGDTARLNDLLDGSCPNRTFVFAPGNVSLDVDDASAAPADRHALVVDDPTAKVVFGAPAWGGGPAPESAFPQACDPSVAGTSVALTARTEIRVRAGRVAMCPHRSESGVAFPSLVQLTTAPADAVAASVESDHFSDPQHLIAPATGPDYSIATFRCSPELLFGTCTTPPRKFTTTWRHRGTAPLSSLRVSLTGAELHANVDQTRTVTFAVTPAGAGSPVCTATFHAVPKYFLTTSYDLLSEPTCRAALTNESQIDGARIETSFVYGNFQCLFGVCYDEALRLKGMTLHTNLWSANATSASSRTDAAGRPDWLRAGNVVADDSADAEIDFQEQCFLIFCVTINRDPERQMDVTGFTAAPGSPPLAPTDRLDGLWVMVKYRPDFEWYAEDGRTTIRLVTADGECTATFNGFVNTTQDTVYDMFRSADCRALVEEAGQLVGSSIVFTVEHNCLTFQVGDDEVCGAILSPRVQHISLLASSDTYRGAVPRSEITQGEDAGFHAAGAVLMPGSDLDVHWRGPAADLPLVSDRLVLHGLGSDMSPAAEMGTVCCNRAVPAERRVRLEARIGGTLQGYAVVDIIDRDPGTGLYDPGRDLSVLEWQLCGGGGCPEPPDPSDS